MRAEADSLEVVTAGDAPGGTAVVLLHGWGAAGDDLVPLADALAAPGRRFYFPAAPLPEVGGGRAWWHLDAHDRPPHGWQDRPSPGLSAHPQVAAARRALLALLAEIKDRDAPKALVVGGFSQGAMLSLDVMLAGAPVDKVVALSGVLLAESINNLHAAPTATRPAVFVAHGRHDPVVPFDGGRHAGEILQRHGYAVTWRPFTGEHEIPFEVLQDVRAFLTVGT